MSKIRVCYLLNDYGVGGVSKVVFDILKGMNFDQFDINIILLSDNMDFNKQAKIPPEVKVEKFNYYFDPDYSLKRYIQMGVLESITRNRAKDVLESIDNKNPDILHLHILPRELLIGILAKKRNPKLQLIYTDHLLRIAKADYPWVNRLLLGLVYRQMYRKYHVVSVSKAVRKCQETYGWLNSKGKHLLLENRIDLSEYKPVDRSNRSRDHKITAVYMARLSDVKGHYELLDAWQKLGSPQIKLKLLGGGELEADLKQYANNHLVGLDVEFAGAVQNVVEYLEEADMAVFPSKKEGLPIALLEKMAMGLPVICSDIPELTDFISHNVNGLIYELGDSTALSASIEFLVKNKERRLELGKEARKSLEERFGFRTMSQLVQQHYKEALGV